jgi:putative transposase
VSTDLARYTYRIRPSAGARRALEAEWDTTRAIWNRCVARDIELRADGFRTPTGYDLCAELTDWRGRDEWLRAGSQNVQANAILDWAKNRQACFKVKGRRPPKFKAKHHSLPTMTYTRNGFKLKAERLVLAGGIVLPVAWHRDLPDKPTSVTVYRDTCGHWWASFVVRVAHEPLPATGQAIGIDWGLKTVAATTNPAFDLPHSKHGRKLARELAKAQRKMARRKRSRGKVPSRGYCAARQETARVYAKVARQRKHEARQWARNVAATHDLIAVENLDTTFMRKNRKLARTTHDARIGDARRSLTEYADRYGRDLRTVNPAGTTMTCGECGVTRTKRLALSERTFHCDSCGHTADRDGNAARVILVRAEMNPPSVDRVRHENPQVIVQRELQSPRL